MLEEVSQHTVGLQQKVPELLTRGTQYLTRKMTWKAFIRSHNPTKLLCLSPKIKCTREITSLTGSSSHTWGNSIAQGLFGAIIRLQPLPWDNSSVDHMMSSSTQATAGRGDPARFLFVSDACYDRRSAFRPKCFLNDGGLS